MTSQPIITASAHQSPGALLSSIPHQGAIEGAAAVSQRTEDQRLYQACAAFESLFIYHLLKEMRAAMPEGEYLGNSMQSQTYTSIFDLEIAKELSAQKGIGLADFLCQQLSVRLNETETQNMKKGDYY
jgi:Rod binding domain-containing protein